MRTWAVGVVVVLIGAGLSSCSSDPESGTASAEPDVCASADALRGSLSDLGDVQVVQEGTDAVQQAWTTVQDDWSELAEAAGDRFADQVDDVEAAAGAVQSSVETTQEEATAQTLGDVAAAVGAFVQDAGSLVDEVTSTC